jgi:phosphotriesterase-related protein
MATVNTVTGPVDSGDLGFALMHEHVIVANWAMRQSYPGWFDRATVIKQAVAGLQAARARGVNTIVDATTANIGRDAELLCEVSERSGVNIIASTGLYWTEEPSLDNWEADRLVDWLVRDITDGMQGTPARAGIIKCGTDRFGLTPLNRKLLRVAARLHRLTGVPITTHTNVNFQTGLLQQEVFAEEGVDLRRVIIGHCGDTSDVEYLEKLLRAGSTLGMDRFWHPQIYPTADRVAIVAELCRRGWATQLVLGHDGDLYSDWSAESLEEHQHAARRSPFCCISDEMLPLLRAAGVTEEQIRQMMVDNPRSIFEQKGPY